MKYSTDWQRTQHQQEMSSHSALAQQYIKKSTQQQKYYRYAEMAARRFTKLKKTLSRLEKLKISTYSITLNHVHDKAVQLNTIPPKNSLISLTAIAIVIAIVIVASISDLHRWQKQLVSHDFFCSTACMIIIAWCLWRLVYLCAHTQGSVLSR